MDEQVACGAYVDDHPQPRNSPETPVQLMERQRPRRNGARPDLRVQTVNKGCLAVQVTCGTLATPVSILTPPLTPQSSFGSKPSSATSESEPFPNFLRAFYDYHPDGPIEDSTQISITLPISTGDLILVHSIQPNGWADGTLLRNGSRGWLPTNYCHPYKEEVMKNLLTALTNVWEFLRGHEGDDVAALASQDYVRGMIAGVRKLLERSGCLSRDADAVSSQQGIRVLRKGLLADLSVFTKKSRAVQERCKTEAIDREVLFTLLDEILLRAFKVVTRAVRFLDCWRQAWGPLKPPGLRGQTELPLGSTPQPLPPTSTRDTRSPQPHQHESATPSASCSTHWTPGTVGSPVVVPDSPRSPDASSVPGLRSTPSSEPSPVSETVLSFSTAQTQAGEQSCPVNRDASNSGSPWCDNVAGPYETKDAEPSYVLHPPSPSPLPQRTSASHRLSHTISSEATSNDALASNRLHSAHEAFLGLIGAFIGLHLHARATMELLMTTQQSVFACGALTNVVDEIWERDFKRSDAVEASRLALHLRLAELVNATKGIIEASDATGEEALCFPDHSKRLMDAATACVRAAGDCVAKSKAVIERTGDFEMARDHVPQTSVSSPPPDDDSPISPKHDHPTPSHSSASSTPKKSRAAAEKPLPATPPPQIRRPRTAIPDEPPKRSLPRPGIQRSASSQSDVNMQLPTIASFRSRSSSLLRQPTVSRRSSETGLRKAGSKVVRATTGSGSNLPTLDVKIPHGSFFDNSTTPTHSSPEELKADAPLSASKTPEDMVRDFQPEKTRQGTLDSADDSVTGSTTTDSKSNSARNSGGSAESHASTRATTPDQSPHKVTSLDSLTTSADNFEDDSAKSNEVESQLLAETFAHELTFNREGQVTGGSLPALVERLTAHDSTPDALFVNTFYLTFRQFTTPVELVQCLIKRYERVGDDHERGGPVRLRVYNVFKQWMEGFWDVDADSEALRLILAFANGRLRFDLPSASHRLLELTLQISDMQSQPNSPKGLQTPGTRPRALSGASPSDVTAPSPIVSKGQLNLLKTMKNGVSACSILDLDPLELARQFTIMQSRIFCAIQPEELLASEWTKKYDSKAVNVKAMSALSTNLANLVADTILQLELKKRAIMIKHWVKIATRCLELNNYDALMAIICSLNSSIVQRLKKTWDIVSPKTRDKFDYLKTIVDFARNYYVLRQRLQGHVAPCLPFVGIYLTDLTFVDCGNQPTRQLPDGSEGQSVINFDKYIKTTRIIGDLQRFQVPFKLTAVPEMQDWMATQIGRVRAADEATMQNYYRRSLLLEPRDGASATPSSKQTPPESATSSFGSTSSKESGKEGHGNKFEFFAGLGLSLNKDKPSS